MTDVPGFPASHSIITPECRTNRTDEGAWDEAVRRAREQYDAIVAGWAGREQQPTLHLVLSIERPAGDAPVDAPAEPPKPDVIGTFGSGTLVVKQLPPSTYGTTAEPPKPRRMQANKSGIGHHKVEHESGPQCAMYVPPCAPVDAPAGPPKPRRMQANPDTDYGWHDDEHDEIVGPTLTAMCSDLGCKPVAPEPVEPPTAFDVEAAVRVLIDRVDRLEAEGVPHAVVIEVGDEERRRRVTIPWHAIAEIRADR